MKRIIAGLFGVLALVPMAPVAADPYPVLPPDEGEHSWCFASNGYPNEVIRDRTYWSMSGGGTDAGVEPQTIVDTVHKAPCGPHTDVMVQQDYMGEGVFGATSCILWAGRCDRFLARISWSEIQLWSTRPNHQARKTICHEIGHTLGADHYPNAASSPDGDQQSCLRSGVHDHNYFWERSYGPHHISHINNWWS